MKQTEYKFCKKSRVDVPQHAFKSFFTGYSATVKKKSKFEWRQQSQFSHNHKSFIFQQWHILQEDIYQFQDKQLSPIHLFSILHIKCTPEFLNLRCRNHFSNHRSKIVQSCNSLATHSIVGTNVLFSKILEFLFFYMQTILSIFNN